MRQPSITQAPLTAPVPGSSMTNGQSSHVIEKLSLHGLLPAQALLSQFDAGQIAIPAKREEVLNAWTSASQSYAARSNPAASFIAAPDVKEYDGLPKEQVADMVARLKNYPPFDTHSTQIAWVPTSKLVTPQLSITVPRLTKRATMSSGMNQTQLFTAMFQAGTSSDPIYRQTLGVGPNGGAILYTSYDEDVRLHQPPLVRKLPINENDPSSAALEGLFFPVGGGTPFATAYRIQILPGVQRLIVANGIHRAAAAALAGMDKIPFAVCDLSPLELPDPFVETPKTMLLDPNFHPPMVSDFANPKLAIKLGVYRPLRTVRFNWNFENYTVGIR